MPSQHATVPLPTLHTWKFPGKPPVHCLAEARVEGLTPRECISGVGVEQRHVKGLKGAVLAHALRQVMHHRRHRMGLLLLLHC